MKPTKRQSIIGGSIAVVVLIVVAIAFASTRSDKADNAASDATSDATGTQPSTGNESTTPSLAESGEQTTDEQALTTTTLEPTSKTLRTPVRCTVDGIPDSWLFAQ